MALRYTFFLIFFLNFPFLLSAQEVSISLGPEEIALNEAFTITLSVKNDKLRTYSSFPTIPGFAKRGTSSSSSTNIINGKVSSEQRVTQTYAPQQEGTFTLSPFVMSVNGQDVRSEGTTITVGPPRQQSRSQQRNNPFSRDPFDQFFGNDDQEEQEFVEVEDDAFLALTVDKEEVYVGEGFTATLAFYISTENQAPLSFYDLGNQLGEIVEKLKPTNSWEENFEIVNVEREDVRINGKTYARYKLHQARYYPLNDDPVVFPPVGLKMLKYKLAKRPSFFGRRKQEAYKTYYTEAKEVEVKELPPHPLKESVAVGDYQLREQISDEQLETGSSFSYSFTIVGQGNISAIRPPEIPDSDSLTFYEPNVTQDMRKDEGTVIGVKQFSYYGIPNEPGTYQLGDYVQWIYFNSRLGNYDTLRSDISIRVEGESRKNENILSKDPGIFYNQMEAESNQLISLNDEDNLELFVYIFVLLMLAATAFIIFKK
ncbi:BatD family protein [Nafulsella turpanensis]|uniref:BatD family protein n=1 Tax=Nafulsella turpanensis TaxID=1265690 RepID=UPI00034D7A27|nr:BatD family protein [Nafulsella turpanensis]